MDWMVTWSGTCTRLMPASCSQNTDGWSPVRWDIAMAFCCVHGLCSVRGGRTPVQPTQSLRLTSTSQMNHKAVRLELTGL